MGMCGEGELNKFFFDRFIVLENAVAELMCETKQQVERERKHGGDWGMRLRTHVIGFK